MCGLLLRPLAQSLTLEVGNLMQLLTLINQIKKITNSYFLTIFNIFDCLPTWSIGVGLTAVSKKLLKALAAVLYAKTLEEASSSSADLASFSFFLSSKL
jgi:hypothetical protein